MELCIFLEEIKTVHIVNNAIISDMTSSLLDCFFIHHRCSTVGAVERLAGFANNFKMDVNLAVCTNRTRLTLYKCGID